MLASTTQQQLQTSNHNGKQKSNLNHNWLKMTLFAKLQQQLKQNNKSTERKIGGQKKEV
jgi:hypothetical protein